MHLPDAPSRSFSSDNAAGAHPEVLAAIAAASDGHAVAYGHDRWTKRATEAFRDHFGDVAVLMAWGGTGANVVALQALLAKWEGVICAQGAHIAVDETGAPERILGAKLIDLPTADGKLTPDLVAAQLGVIGTVHHVQPGVVSITQPTELGTLYTVEEIAALVELAHAHGLRVHLDGARIANAAAALGVPARAFTFDVGVDAVTFGGTKNGMVFGEAVLLADRSLEEPAGYLRKQATQLVSKMRFVSAQMLAMFEGDLWLRSAAHANEMAARLHAAVAPVAGVSFPLPVQVNSMFPILPHDAIEPLQAWCHHYTWDAAIDQVRWMCSWDTTSDDVDRFAAGVAAACA